MNKLLALLLFVSLMALAQSCYGQEDPVTFLGRRSQLVTSDYSTVLGSVEGLPAIESRYPPIGDVLLKMQKRERLTNKEFIAYILAVEAMNPLMGWQQIVTKLHAQCYPQDHNLKIWGVRLFKNGKENEGWEKVTLPMNLTPPEHITSKDGEDIKVAHTFAAIRAGLNRSGVTNWTMSNVNTGWGDSVQVWGERISASGNYFLGAFHDYDKCYAAMDRFSNAPNYKSPDQVLGNEIGLDLQKYLKDHPNAKLSEAYMEFLE